MAETQRARLVAGDCSSPATDRLAADAVMMTVIAVPVLRTCGAEAANQDYQAKSREQCSFHVFLLSLAQIYKTR